jgi:uncharacterized protein (DUF488 family)
MNPYDTLKEGATLYTFGYLSGRAERIIAELIAVKTPIIDVRYNPTSKHYPYTQEGMQKRDGILYLHLEELGNELYRQALRSKQFKEPRIKLHAPEAGLARLHDVLQEYGRAAIFCACASKSTCHRSVVAKLAEQRFGVNVIHL